MIKFPLINYAKIGGIHLPRINKRVIKGIILIGVASSLLFGCNSKKIKEKMDIGISNLNSGKYNEAVNDFNDVLKLDKDNKEAEDLVSIITNYEEAKKSFENNDLNSANTFIGKIPSDYTNYKIKDNIEGLKNDIKVKSDNIKKVDKELSDASNLLANNKLDEARKKILNINMKDANKDQKEKADKIDKQINEKLEEQKKQEEAIKAEHQKKIEQEKKIKEEQLRKENELKQQEAKRSEVDKSSISKKKSTSSNNIHYENRRLGLQMELPADWRGHYKVEEFEDGMNFELINKDGKMVQPLYCIEKRLKNNTMDAIRYKTINGVDYAMGHAPVLFIDTQDTELYNQFERLHNEADLIRETIRGLN